MTFLHKPISTLKYGSKKINSTIKKYVKKPTKIGKKLGKPKKQGY